MLAVARGRQSALQDRRALWSAWHIAVLMRVAEFPSLEELLEPKAPETEEEAKVRMQREFDEAVAARERKANGG